jgi:hypothetical protein
MAATITTWESVTMPGGRPGSITDERRDRIRMVPRADRQTSYWQIDLGDLRDRTV